MAITYNKQVITKDRRVMPSGPRDRQRKQQMEQMVQADHSELITELRNQITALQDRLATVPSGGYSAEQVNVEIMKALKEETAELNKQHVEEKKHYDKKISELNKEIKAHEKSIVSYEKEIASLEKDVSVLKEKLIEKVKRIEFLEEQKPVTDNNVTALLAEATKKIETLSLQMASAGTADAVILDTNRPQMETVFVDPIEKEAKVEKHFDVEVEDVTTNKKEEMAGKVDKLKNLLGKLPTKR